MAKLRREYSIAITVIGGVLLLIFGINYLKGLDLLRKRNVYHAIYRDISGIAETTPLLLNGYKVGSVVNTRLLPENGALVMVSFQVNEDRLRLPKDSRIVLTGDLLNKWAELQLGTSADAAQRGDTLTGDVEPGIAASLSAQIDPLKRKAEGMLVSVDSVLTAFQKVLNPQALTDIDASFHNIRTTLESLDRMAGKLDLLIETESIAISATLRNLESVSGNLKANNERIGSILANLDTASATLAGEQLSRALNSLDSTMAAARMLMTGLRDGQGSLGQLMTNDSLYRNLESASRELDLLLEDLRINPNRYVHLSLFGRKDRLPRLSQSDVERIGDELRKERKP